LIALRAQVEVLKGQAETLESEVKELTERLNMKTSEADNYNRQLVDERGRSDALSNRIGELERQLVAQTTEAEILERRVHELNARADEQGRLLAERDYATDRLRDEAVSTTQIGTAVRAELAEAESRSRAATEILRTEKILLESQLRQAQEERAQLQYDLEIIRHEVEFGEKSAAMFALEAKEKQLAEDLRQTQKDLAARTAALQQAEQSLAGARAKIGELTSNVNDITLTSDKQRVELIALRAQVEVFKGQAETLENEVKELTERLNLKTSEADGYNRQLVDERRRGDAHSNRIGELERQLVAQTTEAGVLERRLQELNARADEQGRLLVERDYVIDRLRNDAASGNQVETAVRAELAEAESRSRAATEILRTEKSLLESQLQQAQEERGQLQHDLETIRREVETWAAERTENAVMRERITDVAAEVARLTSLVEGPGNAIEQILAGDDARANGNGGNGEIKKGSLADRIRALQTRARTPQPTDV
jgi:chromosome segregation ATPase